MAMAIVNLVDSEILDGHGHGELCVAGRMRQEDWSMYLRKSYLRRRVSIDGTCKFRQAD